MCANMSKLLSLKEWLTVEEAARYLTLKFEEEVDEADVLRLALDGHLTLSVNFVNHARGKYGRVVAWEDTEWVMVPNKHMMSSQKSTVGFDKARDVPVRECPPNLFARMNEIPEVERTSFYPFLESLRIDDERYINFDNEVKIIRGVWDLCMLGNERPNVEHAYQILTGGPAVNIAGLDGAFVKRHGGQVCQLVQSFEENEYQPGSRAHLERLKTKIANEKIKRKEAKILLYKYKELRKEFLKYEEAEPLKKNYFPADGLPEDSVLVVRTDALREFERKAPETAERGVEKTLSTTERNTLLLIIAMMAKDGYGNELNKPYEFATTMQKAADTLGIKISDDTIAKKLIEAKKVLADKSE